MLSETKSMQPLRTSSTWIKTESYRTDTLGQWECQHHRTAWVLIVLLRNVYLWRWHQWYLHYCRQTKSVSSLEESGCNEEAGGGEERRWFASWAGMPVLQGSDASYHSVCSWKTFSELLVAWREPETHCSVSSAIQNTSTFPLLLSASTCKIGHWWTEMNWFSGSTRHSHENGYNPYLWLSRFCLWKGPRPLSLLLLGYTSPGILAKREFQQAVQGD